MQVPVADVLRAFGVLGELGRGQPPGHARRACVIALSIADELGTSPEQRSAVYATALLFHAGCTAGGSQFAVLIAADELAAPRGRCLCAPDNLSDVFAAVGKAAACGESLPDKVGGVLPILGESAFADYDRGCSDIGSRVARRLGLDVLTAHSLKQVCETWNGEGTYRAVGAAIPLPTRIVQAAMIAEVFTIHGGLDKGRAAVLERAGTFLDPDVAKAYQSATQRPGFLSRVAKAEPEPELGDRTAALDDVVLALADVVDLKSPRTTAHGRTTADLAHAVAGVLGFEAEEAALLKRAALIHDVGKVAVPRAILDKRDGLTRLEEDQLRLHVAFSERILRSSRSLEPLADVVSTHHAKDGHRSRAASVLYVLDAFLEDRDARTGPSSETTADALAAVRGQVDATVFDALSAVIERVSGRRAPKGPADLSEREIEVLVLVGRGLTNAEIAGELHVSPHTVRHHLEHIYEKIDVTSRAGATLFAAEQGFL